MIQLDTTLLDALGTPLMASHNQEARWCCPFCQDKVGSEDTGYRLYYNLKSDLWFCQRCELGGSKAKLYRMLRLGASPSEGPSLSRWDEAVERFKSVSVEAPSESHSLLEPTSLDDYTRVFPGTDAYSYCLRRGMDDSDIHFHRIGFGTSSLRGRLIFPDYIEEQLVYWTARLYIEDPTGKRPRYKNPDVSKAAQIYNLERAARTGRVIITEGVISAIIAGRDAVATYSKHFTAEQLARFAALDVEFIVAYDGDALKKGIDLSDRLYSRGKSVKMVFLENHPLRKDPACPEVGRLKFQQMVKEAVPYHPVSILKVLLERGILNAG